MLSKFSFIAFTLLAATATAVERPNIVIVLADDMGYSDIGSYGGEVRTPRLDALAADGLRFTQFYNTGRCCPTRASLLTGLYQHQAGVGKMVGRGEGPGYLGRLSENCVTLAEVMRGAGYATAMAGKWHVTHFDYIEQAASHRGSWPLQRGFDRFTGSLAGGGNYYRPKGWMVQNDFTKPGEGFYYTDAVSEAAVGYIQDTPAEKPLFMYVAYTAPHWPLHAHEKDIAKYKGVYDKGWDAIRADRLERMKKLGLVPEDTPLSPRDPRVPQWSNDLERRDLHVRRMETYAAQIECMDRGIGHIVDQLKKSGRFDNTLLLFLADNGGCDEVFSGEWYTRYFSPGTDTTDWGNESDSMPGGPETFQSYGVGWANASNTPFRKYKKNNHEGGIATPLIAHWPRGIDVALRGKLDRQPGHLVDLMATCVDIAGAIYPAELNEHAITPMQGVPLTPAFKGSKLAREQPLFFEHYGHRAIRDGQWKLVKLDGKLWELYDMHADRVELNNRAKDQPERTKQMTEAWLNWAGSANVITQQQAVEERTR